jgi:hypothetical protein
MPKEKINPAVKAKAAAKKALAKAQASTSASASEDYVKMRKEEALLEQQVQVLTEHGMAQKHEMNQMHRYQRHLEQETEANFREAQRWQKDLTLLQNMDHHQEITELRAKLQEAVRGVEVTEYMMDEYAEMALGQAYLENKAYHNGEMWKFAENKLHQQIELAACNRLTTELAQEDWAKGPSASAGTRSSSVRKDSPTKVKNRSPARRSG